MTPKSCKNKYLLYICVLDEGHAGPHQAYRLSHNPFHPLDLAAEWPNASTPEENIMAACRIAAGQSMSKNEYLISDQFLAALGISKMSEKPKGLDSPIAIQMEIERVTKEIQLAHEKMAFGEPQPMPECNHSSCERRQVKGSEFCDAHSEAYEGRLPYSIGLAVDGVTQHKACPGVSYRLYRDEMSDEMLIMACSNENPGWGRMLRVEGRLWHHLKSRTNAPLGEVALTDDDLETLINASANGEAMYFQPWTPTEEDEDTEDRERAEEYLELKKELFRSDPDVIEYVRLQLDIPDTTTVMPVARGRLREGIERAWCFSLEGKQPERDWMKRAAGRASLMLHDRWSR